MFAKAITLIAALASVASAAPTLQRRSSGTMTFYNPAGGTGSCGSTLNDGDLVCAVGSGMNPSSLCGSTISIYRGGKSVSAKVADTCASCASNHIDCTPSVFDQLGDASAGVIDVEFSV